MSKDPRRPEDELVRAARAGDREAFQALYEKYLDRVYATAFRIVGEHDLAADLTQEIFLKVYEELPGFRFESRFSTWLYRIAANRAINKANEISRHARLQEQIARERPATGPRESDSPKKGFNDERVQAALNGLSAKLRAVIVMRYLEGLSYEEVAGALDVSVGTVKSRLFMAHAALKTLLGDAPEES
ncbi:MAG: sigma-70 family RNA polymerase sigma factor [Planctomycetes bacterium]|nr:sigma-70 family RNA polymerase sigma factor [Planctomycetota bacterium]